MSGFSTMTLKDPAGAGHNGTLSAQLHRLAVLTAVVLATSSCTTTSPTEPKSASNQQTAYPIPSRQETSPGITQDDTLDTRIIAWSQDMSSARGWLFAQTELDALTEADISPKTEQFIRSQLLWLRGDLRQSNRFLDAISFNSIQEHDLLLSERQRRFQESQQPIEAAKVALDRLRLAPDTDSQISHSTVFDLISEASVQRLASELRRTEPSSDWHAWLSLNRAFRQGRPALLRWIAEHPVLPSNMVQLPSGLSAWLKAEIPTRIAVLLPLSGRLKNAGQSALNGVIEGLYTQFRDPTLRPDVITIDTEAAVTGKAAYVQALEAGADFVIGPLTKERVAELNGISQLPIPVLALNRGPQDATPAAIEEDFNMLSMSLAPDDEAEQIALLAWSEGLRAPLVIAPDSAWGARMRTAFSGVWTQLGGTIRETALTSPDERDNTTIARSLNTLSSEARITDIERAFEAPVDTQARRRKDIDSVILLAPTPQMAREVRPLLRFHYAGKLPVFAPSNVFQADRSITNRDLNGIKFVLPPSALDATLADKLPLHALGLDAAAFVDHFEQAQGTPGTVVFGNTGDLWVDSGGNVRRRLKPVVFTRGKARIL
ncbi:penicillin-binding protein activator [Luminiphilus sp.]|nr:penicillin-binding protein activator [Luminiphilus sp.]